MNYSSVLKPYKGPHYISTQTKPFINHKMETTIYEETTQIEQNGPYHKNRMGVLNH
jgi:hypothetical protein